MNDDNNCLMDVGCLMDVASRPPVTMVAGQGAWLTDHTGKNYLDFVQGWAVNCFGHSPRIVTDTLTQQASTLLNCSPAFYNAPMLELAQLITAHSGLHQVWFGSGGAEVNEGAIKLARRWGQKYRDGAFEIITLQNSFHGRTLATMAASGKPQWEPLFEPKVPGFTKVPINDIDAVAAAISHNTVAVMLEPVQGEGGVIPATREFLQQLRALTQRKNLLLIFDEVQTGMGRTGSLFAFQQLGVTPDIMTLGKGLGGGAPLSALVAHRDFCCFEHGDQGGTFSGTALMTAVGCAVFKEIAQPKFLANVQAQGEYLRAQLQKISAAFQLGEVRGSGLLVALEIPRENSVKIADAAFAHGLLVNAPRGNALRFMPALTVTREEIDTMAELLRLALTDSAGVSHAA
ncbi:MAG: acetylornithine transaminase [Spongiibacteraceae bacterium]